MWRGEGSTLSVSCCSGAGPRCDAGPTCLITSASSLFVFSFSFLECVLLFLVLVTPGLTLVTHQTFPLMLMDAQEPRCRHDRAPARRQTVVIINCAALRGLLPALSASVQLFKGSLLCRPLPATALERERDVEGGGERGLIAKDRTQERRGENAASVFSQGLISAE